MVMTCCKPKVVLVAEQARVEHRQDCYVCLALHRPPRHDTGEVWASQEYAIKHELRGVVAECAVCALLEAFVHGGNAGMPCMSRRAGLQRIELRAQAISNAPHDFDGKNISLHAIQCR